MQKDKDILLVAHGTVRLDFITVWIVALRGDERGITIV
jgi:hypothetical protein